MIVATGEVFSIWRECQAMDSPGMTMKGEKNSFGANIPETDDATLIANQHLILAKAENAKLLIFNTTESNRFLFAWALHSDRTASKNHCLRHPHIPADFLLRQRNVRHRFYYVQLRGGDLSPA